jgi:predicted RND superfamily exporter protein
VITTAVLTAGFLVLTLSTFKLNFELGLITSMTITFALVIDFLLLPAMLLTFDTKDYATEEDIESDEVIALQAA